jgi:hypothetical protein
MDVNGGVKLGHGAVQKGATWTASGGSWPFAILH